MNNLFAQYYDYNYNYDASASTAGSDAVSVDVFLFIMSFVILFLIIGYVVFAYFLSRIFKKAGVEGWKAWVPIYNSWITLELGGQKGFWVLLGLIPVVNIVAAVFMYIAMYYIGLKLNKSGAFVLWGIFLPFVWYIWLALDDSKWKGSPRKKVTHKPQEKPTAA